MDVTQRRTSLGAQRLEEFVLQRIGFVLSDKDELLVFFEFGCDETFVVNDGLTAFVVFGNEIELALADLDVETEDVVVANAKGADAGGFLLFGLITCNPRVTIGGGGAQLVQVCIVAASNQMAFTNR